MISRTYVDNTGSKNPGSHVDLFSVMLFIHTGRKCSLFLVYYLDSLLFCQIFRLKTVYLNLNDAALLT